MNFFKKWESLKHQALTIVDDDMKTQSAAHTFELNLQIQI